MNTAAPQQGHFDDMKRRVDVLLCLLALPLAAPLMVLSALLVRTTSSGPILFSQSRTGKDGRRFRMFKFRTMWSNAPELREYLKQKTDIEGPDFKLERDPRITPVGSLLRKTSLDELPQLWNILCGDMSWVGPRPTSFSADTYRLWHTERLEVRPGLTGLWQIEKRGDTNFDERVRLDIAYVRNRSLWLDLRIMLRTVPSVLMQRGAF